MWKKVRVILQTIINSLKTKMPTVCRSSARPKDKVGTDPAGKGKGSKETDKAAEENRPRGKGHGQTAEWMERRTRTVPFGKLVGLFYLCSTVLCQVNIS